MAYFRSTKLISADIFKDKNNISTDLKKYALIPLSNKYHMCPEILGILKEDNFPIDVCFNNYLKNNFDEAESTMAVWSLFSLTGFISGFILFPDLSSSYNPSTLTKYFGKFLFGGGSGLLTGTLTALGIIESINWTIRIYKKHVFAYKFNKLLNALANNDIDKFSLLINYFDKSHRYSKTDFWANKISWDEYKNKFLNSNNASSLLLKHPGATLAEQYEYLISGTGANTNKIGIYEKTKNSLSKEQLFKVYLTNINDDYLKKLIITYLKTNKKSIKRYLTHEIKLYNNPKFLANYYPEIIKYGLLDSKVLSFIAPFITAEPKDNLFFFLHRDCTLETAAIFLDNLIKKNHSEVIYYDASGHYEIQPEYDHYGQCTGSGEVWVEDSPAGSYIQYSYAKSDFLDGLKLLKRKPKKDQYEILSHLKEINITLANGIINAMQNNK